MDQSKTYLLKTRYKRRIEFRKANRKLTACAGTLGSLSFALGIQPVFNSIRYKGRRKFHKANRKLTAYAGTLGSLPFALGIQPVFNFTRYKRRIEFRKANRKLTACAGTLGSLSFALGIQPVFNFTRYKGRRKFRKYPLTSTSSPLTLLSHLKSTASQNTNEQLYAILKRQLYSTTAEIIWIICIFYQRDKEKIQIN